MPVPRYAISYTPPPESPLARFGAGVLGYDCFHGRDARYVPLEGLEPAILRLMTVGTRRHGFHAPFIGPFRLDKSEDELFAELERFARQRPVVPLGPLAISMLDRFVVLQPVVQPAMLDEFAAGCLETFDPYCAASPPAQCHAVVRDRYRFQMRLAGFAPDAELRPVVKALTAAFAAMTADHLELDAISLLREDDATKRFRVVERWRLSGR